MDNNFDELIIEKYNRIAESDLESFVKSLYTDISKMRDARNIVSRLYKYQNPKDNTNLYISQFIYYAMLTCDIHYPEFYDKVYLNLTRDNIEDESLGFLNEILSNQNISIEVTRKLIYKLMEFTLDVDTKYVVQILIIVHDHIKANKLLANQVVFCEIDMLRKSIPQISKIATQIKKLMT